MKNLEYFQSKFPPAWAVNVLRSNSDWSIQSENHNSVTGVHKEKVALVVKVPNTEKRQPIWGSTIMIGVNAKGERSWLNVDDDEEFIDLEPSLKRTPADFAQLKQQQLSLQRPEDARNEEMLRNLFNSNLSSSSSARIMAEGAINHGTVSGQASLFSITYKKREPVAAKKSSVESTSTSTTATTATSTSSTASNTTSKDIPAYGHLDVYKDEALHNIGDKAEISKYHDANLTITGVVGKKAKLNFYSKGHVIIAKDISEKAKVSQYSSVKLLVEGNVGKKVKFCLYGESQVVLKGKVDPSVKFEVYGNAQVTFEQCPPQEVLNQLSPNRYKIKAPINAASSSIPDLNANDSISFSDQGIFVGEEKIHSYRPKVELNNITTSGTFSLTHGFNTEEESRQVRRRVETPSSMYQNPTSLFGRSSTSVVGVAIPAGSVFTGNISNIRVTGQKVVIMESPESSESTEKSFGFRLS